MNHETDYYKILEISENASAEEIKKAYREMARKYHPDNLINVSEERKKQLENEFKKMGEAYHTLSDSEKRKQYDLSRKTKKVNTIFKDDYVPSWETETYSSDFSKRQGTKIKKMRVNPDIINNILDPFFSFKTHQKNNTTKQNNNFDDIIAIEEEIQLANEEIEKLYQELSQVKDDTDYEQKLRQFESKLKENPRYQEAQNYIQKIYKKDNNRITSLLISKEEKQNFENSKAYLDDVNKKIKEKETSLEEEKEEKQESLDEKRKMIRLQITTIENKKKTLEKKYKEHPLYGTYEVYKMTENKMKNNVKRTATK